MGQMIPTEGPAPFLIFLGVSTGQSAVHRVFDGWVSCLGTPLTLKGCDLPLDAPADAYRRLVLDFRRPVARLAGALVTSHKTALFQAAADLFDDVTAQAVRLEEIGMIYWRDGRLVADAGDADSNLQAARRLFAASDAWRTGSREAVVLGGGGAGVALAYTLATAADLGCARITITEVSEARAEIVRRIVQRWAFPVPIVVMFLSGPADAIVADSGRASLIANATGLGKDRTGSPVSSGVRFPRGAFVWDFNYRFGRQEMPTFLETASAQAAEQELTIEDGWNYFIWGWLVVMSRVAGVDPYERHECFSRVASRPQGNARGITNRSETES